MSKVLRLPPPLLAAILLGAYALAPAGATAQTHDAHEHGAARLNLVIEDDGFAAELDGALAGFISFEHQPSTEAQRTEVKEMAAKLGQAEALFQAPAAAGCRAAAVALGSENLPQELLAPYPAPTGHGHDEADHDHDGDHDADHDHDGEPGHDDDHDDDGDHDEADHDHDGDHDEADHDHDGGHAHSDLEAAYDFKCSNPAALTTLTIGLFEAFPGLAQIEVQMITPDGQAAASLTPADKVLRW